MRIGMITPISWRVPPRGYGPWERVVSLLTEGLVERGLDVSRLVKNMIFLDRCPDTWKERKQS
jgi:hypothetical protein